MSGGVKVAVRVRPFNQREKDLNATLCIDMQNTTTTIFDLANQDEGKEGKHFNFDYSFWSHDQFDTNDEGYTIQNDSNSRYCDQRSVYESMGKEILDNAWEGYHCCLFAYGQTGSGKSYSMVGYGANKGIVPISCDEIFKRIKETTNDEKSYEVCVSMLEIYNEKIQDLLVPLNDRPPLGLKVRESKTLGIFVDNLSKHIVTSYEEIKDKMDSGYDNRTIGSTLMNASSSRAHTIVTMEFKQITKVAGKKTEKVSNINLVDLAGSERAASTGATGDRLKEGCNINKSLLVLGNVINTLADKAMGKKKDVLPPYRDSNLTRILQSALGGNAKTVMICALSPANINYEETLSTLRYAERAKKIQNKAVVNESESDKIVRLLKEENNDLKKMIEDMNKGMNLSGGLILDDDKRKFLELKEQFEANSKQLTEHEKTFEEKLEEQKIKEMNSVFQKVDISKPHLIVLNEDPQLSHKLKYSLKDLPLHVGRKHGNPTPDILLSGIGIKINHATFEDLGGTEVMLFPNDENAQDFIFINGQLMQDDSGEILTHKDRITFGTNTIFLYMKHSNGTDIYEFDWEKGQIELQKEAEINLKKKEEQKEIARVAELKEMEEKYTNDKIEIEKMKKEIIALKNKDSSDKIEPVDIEGILRHRLKTLEMDKAKHKRELELKEINENRKIFQNNKNNDFKHKSQKLEQNLQNVLRKLHKMNVIVSEIRRNVKIEAILLKNIPEFLNDDLSNNSNILIRVENYEVGSVYYWNTETFQNRYDLMKDIFNRYLDEDFDISNLPLEDDPLWDEPKSVHVGSSYYKLEPLGYLLNNPTDSAAIITSNNQNVSTFGNLSIDVIPHDENGNEYETVPEVPEELIGQSLQFTVSIQEIKNLPEYFCQSVYVEYESLFNTQSNKTKTYGEKEKAQSYILNETFEHYIEYLTKEDIDYMKTENINFKVYAIESLENRGKLPDNILSYSSKRTSINNDERKSRLSMSIDSKKLALIQEEAMRRDKKEISPFKKQDEKKNEKKSDCLIF